MPSHVCRLVSLSEMNIAANDLEELPPSVGLLRHLRTLYADENFLEEIPPEARTCSFTFVWFCFRMRVSRAARQLRRSDCVVTAKQQPHLRS